MKLLLVLLGPIPLIYSLALQSYPTTCSTSKVLNGVLVNGSVPMGGNPLTPFDSPMLSTFNSTSVEDWSFDGVSSDSQSGLSITLSRGTTTGHPAAQRAILAIAWPDGTHYINLTYFDESTITICPGTVTGTWKNNSSGDSWTFQASDDYTHTLVTIDSAAVKGTYKLTSVSPPMYPNGLQYPNKKGNPLFAPLLYWVENVPVGIVVANITINGVPLIFNGIGGRERNWNSKPWGEISSSWDMARGSVGPYTFIAWSYISNIDQKTYFSMVLMKLGKVIFTTQVGGNETITKKSGVINSKTDGNVHLSSPGMANSKSTGYIFEMVTPGTGERWKFEIDFTKSVYWFPASKTANIGGFVGNVSGGLVGGKQYVGLSSGNLQELV